MTPIVGHDRSQTLLLPELLDEYVGQDTIAAEGRVLTQSA